MHWTHPDLDITGLVSDLGIPPRVARPLLAAVTDINDRGLRALLVSAILHSEPHRYAIHLGKENTRFSGSGGRVLRAAQITRALALLVSDPSEDGHAEMIAGALLGSFSPGAQALGSRPHGATTRRWLTAHARADCEHLDRWGCRPAQIRQVVALSTAAAASVGERAPRTGMNPRMETRLAVARYAADGAVPLDPRIPPIPSLPPWMRMDIPRRDASRNLWAQIDRGLTERRISARASAEVLTA